MPKRVKEHTAHKKRYDPLQKQLNSNKLSRIRGEKKRIPKGTLFKRCQLLEHIYSQGSS